MDNNIFGLAFIAWIGIMIFLLIIAIQLLHINNKLKKLK